MPKRLRRVGYCKIHVRLYMPAKHLIGTKFICCVCDKLIDPKTNQWTATEYRDMSYYTNTGHLRRK